MDHTRQPTRRHVLRAGLTLPLLLKGQMTSNAKTNGRVVIVGAGLSGLAAARALAGRGAEVVVVEARDRIGGRIWTSRAWPDMPMDLGASWIHGVSGNPLTALADEARAARVSTSYESSRSYDASGQALPDEDDSADRVGAVLRKARAATEKAERDVSLAQAVQASPAWTSASAAERRVIRHVINGTVEQEYGGDWGEVSAWYYDETKEFSGEDALFPKGYDQITAMMARGLDVRLGHAVRALERTAAGVRLVFTDGAALEADQAILTVPLGVLRAGSITFGTPLAPRRQQAIDTLRMGLLNKCWLRFDRVAWPDDVDWIEWMGPEPGVWAQWVSLAQAAKLPVLLGFHAGAQAREMERRSDADMMAAAHAALRRMFGSSFPAPRAAQVTRWSQDPFARGSYSFNAVGTTPQTRRDLAGADWEGRLIFAGEATSAQYFGTAHGAVLSGRDAAKTLGL